VRMVSDGQAFRSVLQRKKIAIGWGPRTSPLGEGSHVEQVVSGNFAARTSENYKHAHALNELEGYRRGLDVTNQYSFAGNPGLESEWGVEFDKIAELTDVLRNSPYSSQVANWPCNYQLANGDQCPATSCYSK
jgi:hypothetical protein